MEQFKIDHECTEEEKEIFGESRVRITNFRKVTICIGDKTKIIYRKGHDLFVVEDLDPDSREDVDDYTSSIEGPQAVSIVDTIIRSAKKRGATFIWSGIHYELCKPACATYEDCRTIDYVEDEDRRKKNRRRKRMEMNKEHSKDGIDYTLVENDRRKGDRRKCDRKKNTEEE